MSRIDPFPLLSLALVVAGLWFREGVPFMGDSWALAKIALVFVFMVTLLRHKANIGIVLLLSAVVLGGMFSLPVGKIGRVLVFDVGGDDARLHELLFKTVVLVVIIFLINGLGRLLEAAGTMRRLIHSLDDLISDGRYVMAAIPAAIGLLPMPGGAMLSAPFVGEMGDRMEVGAANKTLVNYWFRHIFEYAWPLYPAVIIAADLTGRSVAQVMTAQAPMVLAAVGVGVVFLHLRLESRSLDMGHEGTLASNLLSIVLAVWPVIVVAVVVGLAPRIATGKMKDLLFPAALVAVNVIVALTARLSRSQIAGVVRQAFSWQNILLVVGIYVLRAMFEKTNVTGSMPQLLANLHIPQAVIIFCVPFVVGLLTGYNVAAVSTGLPALIALLGTPGDLLIAYCGAFFGVLLSPVHLCLILTNDYFKSHLGSIYKALVPMLAAMLCIMAGYSMLLR